MSFMRITGVNFTDEELELLEYDLGFECRRLGNIVRCSDADKETARRLRIYTAILDKVQQARDE